MKKGLLYSILCSVLIFTWGCMKDTYEKYPKPEVYSIISIYDIMSLFKGDPVSLNTSTMFGASQISGVVFSDHSDKNIPEGLVLLQDRRRLDILRSIAVNIGADASKYVPGDSIVITVDGGSMQRVNGILQITGIDGTAVSKVGEKKEISALLIGNVSVIEANPDVYENSLVIVTQALFDPPSMENETFSGEKTINNGSGKITVHTQPDAVFASKKLPYLATYSGLLFNNGNKFSIWPRTEQDIIVLSEDPPQIAPVVVTGFLNNAIGDDANYEYIQLMATQDIDFSKHNMSVVTCNNAGGSVPGEFPVNGWATGGTRTYKFNLTSGAVTKGTYFYVGANKLINGEGSTDISSANWIVSRKYNEVEGDNFGSVTGNLLANSGNVAGIAVFDTIAVDSSTVPVDVVMFGTGANGKVFSAGPPAIGYKITNTDYFEMRNSAVPTLDAQPFYALGTNVNKLSLVNDEKFRLLGGIYNIVTGKWINKRSTTHLDVPKSAAISLIETGATKIEE